MKRLLNTTQAKERHMRYLLHMIQYLLQITQESMQESAQKDWTGLSPIIKPL